MISGDSILRVIDRHKQIRRELAIEGLYSKQLKLADYLTVYDELKKYATIDEILEKVLEIYNVDEIQVHRIQEESKPIALVFICGLFEINNNDFPLVGDALKIIVKTLNEHSKYFAKNALESVKMDQAYNIRMSEFETKCSIETKNDLQYASHLARLYADICEGLYGIATSKMAFHASILKGKPKLIQRISDLSVSDRINIIKSYDIKFGSRLELKYEPIIRNAASHEGIDFSTLPIIKFTEKNRDGRIREVRENVDTLRDRISDLFSISSVILTAETISGFHPKFNDILSLVDYQKIIPHLEIEDIERRFKRLK